MSTKKKMMLGIDLGGTKIEVIVLDDTSNERYRKRVPTPARSYDEIIRCLVDLVMGAEKALGMKMVVGIGTPGTISPSTGLVKNSNTVCLIGKPLDRDLSAALSRPICMANDADCFTLSEAIDGAAKKDRIVFGVIVGTGTGGGIVVDGKLVTGPNAISGEWGHNPLPWPLDSERPGPACYCGLYGCVETFLSGPGLSRDYLKVTGDELQPVDIVELSEKGQEMAERVMARYEDRFARALAGIINILDPHIIVLGGGLSNIQRLYKNIPRIWHSYVFSDTVTTKLVRAAFGDSSGVRGAAWLGRDLLEKSPT